MAFAGIACFGAVVAAVVADWASLPPARAFRVRRGERPPAAQAEEAELAAEVSFGPAGRLVVRAAAALPDGVERVADPAAAEIAAGETARFVTRVRPMRRGEHALGPVHLRWKSALGLAEREAAFALPAKLRVMPGIGAAARSARRLAASRSLDLGVRRTQRRGEGTSFESLREHVRGEDPRRIDWKASARHGKLIARHYEVERNQSVVLLVDCGRWMTAETDGLTRLDRVLESCVLLADAAVARDDKVGLLAFADDVLAWVPPARGRAAARAVLEAAYRIEPRLVESDYAGAFAYLARRHRRRSLVVLFTDVLSREASREVVAECARSARRHLPLAVALRDGSLDALVRSVPASAAAAYRQAAAEELLTERDEALTVMRRAGVQVLDCAPAAMGPALVERYLDLKARLMV